MKTTEDAAWQSAEVYAQIATSATTRRMAEVAVRAIAKPWWAPVKTLNDQEIAILLTAHGITWQDVLRINT